MENTNTISGTKMKKKTNTLDNFITWRAGTKDLDYGGGKDDTNGKGIKNNMRTSKRSSHKKIKRNTTSVTSNNKLKTTSQRNS